MNTVAIPQDLQDLLNTAELSYDAALQADADHAVSVQALQVAQTDEAAKMNAAATAHQQSAVDANAALDALKKHFGLS